MQEAATIIKSTTTVGQPSAVIKQSLTILITYVTTRHARSFYAVNKEHSHLSLSSDGGKAAMSSFMRTKVEGSRVLSNVIYDLTSNTLWTLSSRTS